MPDPCYVCTRCGGESPQWQALCPECGGFDTLLWRSPPSGDRIVIAQSASAGAPLMLPSPDVPGTGGVARSLFRPPASGLAPPSRWDK
jgi:hypothetical protein